MQRMLAVDSRVQRQRVVMQQLADMRQSASSLRERVAKLSGDVHPRMLSQVGYTSVSLLHGNSLYCNACALQHAPSFGQNYAICCK